MCFGGRQSAFEVSTNLHDSKWKPHNVALGIGKGRCRCKCSWGITGEIRHLFSCVLCMSLLEGQSECVCVCCVLLGTMGAH